MTNWMTPIIEEINCGMEITSYESADYDGDTVI